MTNSSPAFVTARRDAIIASVDPQQTVISVSGSTSSPCVAFIRRAMASRRFFAPQVMAYWFTSRSEEHTSELQSPCNLVCRLLLEKKKIEEPGDVREGIAEA